MEGGDRDWGVLAEEREQRDGVARTRTALGLGEVDMVMGQFKVSSIVTGFATVLIMTIHTGIHVPGCIPCAGGLSMHSRCQQAEVQLSTYDQHLGPISTITFMTRIIGS